MNKHLKTTQPRAALTLGDLILAVSSSSHSKGETLAAVTDLLRSGCVRIAHRRCQVRVVA